MGKIIGGIIVLVVVIAGAWWWMSGTKKDTMEQPIMMEKEDAGMMKEEEKSKPAMMPEDGTMKKDEGMVKPEESMMKKDEGAMMKSTARYATYGPNVLEQTKDTRRVLFFYANWCPQCRPTDAELQDKMSEIPSDVTVIRVNYNDPDTDEAEKSLAQKYGVTYQHTFVQIDRDGNVVTKWNGGKLMELLKNIK